MLTLRTHIEMLLLHIFSINIVEMTKEQETVGL
nr:MAG TPA: hypothetical protein [Caudoviricetes sp.]